ncbi:MAG: 50S ribosomal protein L11 methyltransferase [Rubricoccaceae bacterium]|nr:50S ribosomal protein L11 methyltransferase [Rubricoccaceae bacterium]
MTVALTVTLPDHHHELLIAELADLGFDAFEREDASVTAYGPAAIWTGVAREAVEDWLRRRGLPERLEERTMLAVNWNAQWERTLRPIPAGRFVIVPTWAEVPPEHADKTLLRIDPQMSFGTGYHESTRLALGFLPGLVRGGERVLDAGTGTGILAIATLRLGAASALGFDIDPWSAENATENAERNGVADRFEVREGGLEVVPEAGFDLVLANIHLEELRALLPPLTAKMTGEGRLVLAGLLEMQREPMVEAALAAGLALDGEATEGEWWACVCKAA